MLGEDIGVLVAEIGQEGRRALDVGEDESDGPGGKIAHRPNHGPRSSPWLAHRPIRPVRQ